MKKLLSQYRHAWVFLYGLIYFPWFFALERVTRDSYYLIHCRLDDKIPFCEYFIVPYLLWFAYVGFALVWFLIKESKRDFYQLTGTLFVGMSVCLLICTVFPNGLNLRQEIDPSQNVFTWLVAQLYGVDTSTNVFPSIHVFSSVAIHFAIRRSELAERYPIAKWLSGILMVGILLSTVCLKQHSVIDVTGGILLAVTLYQMVYCRDSEVESRGGWISSRRYSMNSRK